jgi:hypothetical protein
VRIQAHLQAAVETFLAVAPACSESVDWYNQLRNQSWNYLLRTLKKFTFFDPVFSFL